MEEDPVPSLPPFPGHKGIRVCPAAVDDPDGFWDNLPDRESERNVVAEALGDHETGADWVM